MKIRILKSYLKESITYIKNYAKSHIWCPLVGVILLSFFTLLSVSIIYTKAKYYQYLVDTTLITEKALSESIIKNLHIQLNEMINFGSSLSVSSETVDVIGTYIEQKKDADSTQDLYLRFQNIAGLSANLMGISLLDKDGAAYQFRKNRIYIGGMPNLGQEDNEALKEIFAAMYKENRDNKIPRYRIYISKEHISNDAKGAFHIIIPIKNKYQYTDIKAAIVFTYSMKDLWDIVSQVNEVDKDYVYAYVENEYGDMILSTGRYQKEELLSYEQKKSILVLEKEIEDYDWILKILIDEAMIKRKVDAMYHPILWIYMFAIALIFTILFFWVKHILKPVRRISESIDIVKNQMERKLIRIEGQNEIWRLAGAYNEMLEKIWESNDALHEQHMMVIESMKMKQKAEREALESQINAHFICNTLNAINYEAMDSGNHKVSVLLKHLANILRYTFDRTHQNVYIMQEISWVEQYLFLQKARLMDTFDYEIDFDADYGNWPCRKLMLQPFVENSILHGFEGRNHGGKIKIIGKGYKENLMIVIEDNGYGIPKEKVEIIRRIIQNPGLSKEESFGIGISNVLARMKLYYGEDLKVSIESDTGKGTRFVFILPMVDK